MTDRPTLEQALADFRGEAAVLRANGHKAQAESIERVCETVAETMHDYLTKLTVDEVMLRSGRPLGWVRSKLAQWQALGLAAREGEGRRARWLVRALAVPQRANTLAAYEAGRQGVA